jgi:hypothetical protein
MSDSVTVQEAIGRAAKMIEQPPRYIQAIIAVVGILLLIFDFSWWDLAFIPLAVLLSSLYAMWATPRWRIWAYENVADIHQFERSAELAGYIAPQSYETIDSFTSFAQKEQLKELQKRFLTEPVFIDDPSIPAETIICAKAFFGSSNRPLLILSESGIQVPPDDTFTWDQIINDHVAAVSFSRMSARTGEDISAGTKDFFRFRTPEVPFEFPLSSLAISDWKLDLLLYTYRGRSKN